MEGFNGLAGDPQDFLKKAKKILSDSKIIDNSIKADIKVPFKFKEDEICQEIFNYVGTTYTKHYVGKNNIQALDLIIASGHGRGFCLGNILKYASRWGKKAGNEGDDLMKIIHYAIFLKYIYEEELKEKNA